MTERSITRIHPVTRMGGDSQVDGKSLVIPPGYWELFDPFLMLAEDWFSTPGFDWHPHRGIETVTTVLDGALEHGDNLGNAGVLGPGDVQWMTAGRGIIHRELAHRNEHVHTLQLWVNLPSTHKLVDSAYRDVTPDDPTERASHNWPVSGGLVTLEPGTSRTVDLDADRRAFLYVMSGRVLAGATRDLVGAGEVAWSDPGGSTLTLAAPEGDDVVKALLFAGKPIGEPVVARGPFVMNSAAEIQQAFVDYHEGRFGDIPALARL